MTQPIVIVVPGQTYYISNKTHGGFIYFSLGQLVSGASQSYLVIVANYRGLKPPSFFVGVNRYPTLESYDYSNNTVQDGVDTVWRWTQQNPIDSMPVIGMFVYGTFSTVFVRPHWKFNYEVIPFGDTVTKSFSHFQVFCGQFQVSESVFSYTLQVSREEPGGYPIFYVGKGYTPSSSKNEYALDTSKDSFQELTVKKPNDPSYVGPNPGLWIVCTNSFSGGFILGVTVSK